MDYAVFRTRAIGANRSGGFLSILVKLLAVVAAGIALLAMMLIGLFVVLPLLLAGSVVAYVYLRRRVRQAQMHPQERAKSSPRDDIIDAEYTIIERQ